MTDEQISALAMFILGVNDNPRPLDVPTIERMLRTVVEDHPAFASQSAGEPVAWLYTAKPGYDMNPILSHGRWLSSYAGRKFFDERALFASPPPTDAAVPVEGLRDLLMEVVCDTEHPDRQLRASRMLEVMQRAPTAARPQRTPASNPYPPGPLHDAWQCGIEGRRLWSHPVDGCVEAYRSARRLVRATAALPQPTDLPGAQSVNVVQVLDALAHLPIERTIRPLRRGSDYYGPCEFCGKHMSEAFGLHTARVHPDGRRLEPNLSNVGHEDCVNAAIALAQERDPRG